MQLNMDIKHLEANLVALLTDVNKMRPKRDGKFITRVLFTSPPSGETLKIDPFVYIPEDRVTTSATQSVEEFNDDEKDKVEATG